MVFAVVTLSYLSCLFQLPEGEDSQEIEFCRCVQALKGKVRNMLVGDFSCSVIVFNYFFIKAKQFKIKLETKEEDL